MSGIRSLKEKRHALRGTLQRLAKNPMLGVAEVGDHDLWGNAEIGIAAVANDIGLVESMIQQAIDHFDEGTSWEVHSVERGLEHLA